MNVIFVSSESIPFVKTGGLADVVGELPNYLNEHANASVFLPKYSMIKEVYLQEMEFLMNFSIKYAGQDEYVGVFKIRKNNTDFYFIDNEKYFKRDKVYGFDDDCERFGYFSVAVLEAIMQLGLQCDIIHCHDWHTGMVPVLLKEKYQNYQAFKETKSVVTIHNPAYQGLCDKYETSRLFNLDMKLYFDGKLRFKECLSYLKSGIIYADKITTVSKTHAEELMLPEYAYGLQSILELRKDDFIGIVNGIDYKTYNPLTDKKIFVNYRSSYAKKKENKKELELKMFGDNLENTPLIGMVTRLTWQKGIDIVNRSIDELMKNDVRLVVLGSGDYALEESVVNWQRKYPGRISTYIGYDDDLAHKIYAGCDYFLMPSFFEPCGISQMIALRYGTLPIVRETGGLKDTVLPYDEYKNVGDGFGFINYDEFDLIKITNYALSFYNNKEVMEGLFKRALKKDLSWKASAKEYINLYKSLIEK